MTFVHVLYFLGSFYHRIIECPGYGTEDMVSKIIQVKTKVNISACKSLSPFSHFGLSVDLFVIFVYRHTPITARCK